MLEAPLPATQASRCRRQGMSVDDIDLFEGSKKAFASVPTAWLKGQNGARSGTAQRQTRRDFFLRSGHPSWRAPATRGCDHTGQNGR